MTGTEAIFVAVLPVLIGQAGVLYWKLGKIEGKVDSLPCAKNGNCPVVRKKK